MAMTRYSWRNAWVAEGHVFGFDIQALALENTSRRLRDAGLEDRVALFAASHAAMSAHIPEHLQGKIKAIMFNLGYLPGGDKTLVTQAGSTVAAVEAACRLLAGQGAISIMAYPGHAGGDREASELDQYLRALQTQAGFAVECLFSQHHRANAPRLFIIRKF